jgi:hypothetical protein
MTGDPIPDPDNVVKYLSPSKYNGGKLDWHALTPRESDEGENSCFWMNYFSGLPEEQLARIRATCELTLRSNGRFAELNVGRVRQEVLVGVGLETAFTHQPLGNNESHSVMTGLSHDNEAAGFILNRCVLGYRPAVIT